MCACVCKERGEGGGGERDQRSRTYPVHLTGILFQVRLI